MSDIMITQRLGGYQPVKDKVPEEARTPPRYPNGRGDTFPTDFHAFGNHIQEILTRVQNQPMTINFSQAFVLMQDGYSLISPSNMDKKSYLRLMDDTGVRRLYLYEYHGAQNEYVRRSLDTVDTDLILATDWAIFVDLDKKIK